MASEQAAEAELFDALDDVDAALAAGDLAQARARLDAVRARFGADHADVCYADACLTWEELGAEAAASCFERVVALEPEHADAWHALACIAEERGDRTRMIELFLKVHALDARGDREAHIGTRRELDHIERIASEVLDALPAQFGERLAHVPVVLERRPSRALVRDGFDPRALGLFEGIEDGAAGAPTPTRIVLFANNLLADFPDQDELDEQIEITLLHEIGHFFGLDEDDMERLGLD